MVTDEIISMEGPYNFLGGFESLSVRLLLLEHFLLVSFTLVSEVLYSLCDHVIDILWLFVYGPTVLYLNWLELILILVHKLVDLTVLFNLDSHLLNLCCRLAFQVVFKLTCLLYICCHSFYFLLDLFELFQLFMG
jgi:hypothetical protein